MVACVIGAMLYGAVAAIYAAICFLSGHAIEGHYARRRHRRRHAFATCCQLLHGFFRYAPLRRHTFTLPALRQPLPPLLARRLMLIRR